MVDLATDDGASGAATDDTSAPAGGGTSIESMVNDVPSDLLERRTATQRERMAETDKVTDRYSDRLEEDRARMKSAFDATGIEPGTLQPWDADKARATYRTDPIQAFGSLGSVFAMIAAGFTHAPMENALLGGAAAMNAVNAGDQRDFEHAFDAWKQNNDLALKRHNIMQQSYQNATTLMSSDMTAGRAQLQMLASKYDDKQLLTLMEAGLDKDALDLMDKRNKLAIDAVKVSENTTQATFKQRALKTIVDQNQQIQDPMKRAVQNLSAYKRIYDNKVAKPEDEAFGQWLLLNPNATDEDMVKKAQDLSRRMGVRTQGRAVQEEIDARIEEKMRPVEEGGKGLTRAQAFAEANQEVQAESKGITPNLRQKLEQRRDAYDSSMAKIDKVTGVLNNYIGAAGAPGYARRIGERVSNLAGSKDTNLVQMMRDIEYLRLEAPRLLLGSDGRPLSAEASKINDIIAGLNAGDTTANTIRALREVKMLYAKMRAGLDGQLKPGRLPAEPGGSGAPSVEVGEPEVTTPRQKPKWSDAPVIQ